MPAKITSVISSSNFELIRDRIAQILAIELANQYILSADELLNLDVWTERFIPFDKTDLPAVNVAFISNTYDHLTPITAVSTNKFYIDISANALHSEDGINLDGDKLAILKVQKLTSIVRSILEHPAYIKLDFDTMIIRHTEVSDIQISIPENVQDSLNTVTGRVIFTVDATDVEPELQPIEADKYLTEIS